MKKSIFRIENVDKSCYVRLMELIKVHLCMLNVSKNVLSCLKMKKVTEKHDIRIVF